MLLSALLAYRVGPVSQLDTISHFSHDCLGKNQFPSDFALSFFICDRFLLYHQHSVVDPVHICKVVREYFKKFLYNFFKRTYKGVRINVNVQYYLFTCQNSSKKKKLIDAKLSELYQKRV